MKKTFMAIVALACAALVCSCGSKGTKITEGNHGTLDSLSYCLGANIGGGIKQQLGDIPFDIEVVKKGIKEGLTNKAAQTHDEAVDILREFFSQTLGERRSAYQEAALVDTTAVFQVFETAEECEKISYAFGNDIGCNIEQSKLPIQYYWMLEGLKEAWNGNAKLTQEQVMVFLNHYFSTVVPAEAAERSAKWLEKMEKKSGVKKTESGLLYKVVKEGDMSKAAKSDEDIVKVHYVGRLQDGTVFDASRFKNRSKEQQEMMRKQMPTLFDEKGNIKEEKPVEFPLNRVIKGWTEGMKLVGPGGKIMLYIPAELAYGRAGAGNHIGPNEALEFEVELLEVTPAPAKEETPAVEEKAEEKKNEKAAKKPAKPSAKKVVKK
jgi:FKBP-type peptidyl-prolyl cis-trans isomerase FkpA